MLPKLPLDQMTVEEKILTMESLWDSLCHEAGDPGVPDWHGDVLAEREAALARGEIEIEDWDLAKQRIRERLK